jgi:hypothetical protein
MQEVVRMARDLGALFAFLWVAGALNTVEIGAAQTIEMQTDRPAARQCFPPVRETSVEASQFVSEDDAEPRSEECRER